MSVPSGSKVKLTDHRYSTSATFGFDSIGLVVASQPAALDGYSGKYIAGSFNAGVMPLTSGVGAAQDFYLEIGPMQQMDIIVICSAGTATLKLSVTNDGGITYYEIDSIAAAATHYKHYDKDHLATTHALNPMCWRNVHVEIGAAGAGNTTTATVAMKA